jgi:hypothetical protein
MTRIRMGPVPGLVLVLALVLAVAGCGGGGNSNTTSPGGSSDPKQAALSWAKCMRQHGINIPDPAFAADGGVQQQLPKGVDPDTPKFKAVAQACKQYQPDGGVPEKVDPQLQQQMLAFARCMRQHGINIPDPTPDGRVDMRGIDTDASKFKAAERACPGFRPKY